ncbi:RDD family protein [Uliginosibacterium sp. H3]|uniref:RDD family protein n=1 Tax=Uliginosibacterium silvisoli TaxID=3114758 RepID=A0ABU6K2S0_9RHOO|nr:RDD family protein [Uliginosibacterium sp. H3]
MNTAISHPTAAARPAVELASLRRRLAAMLYESLPTFGVGAVTWFAPLVFLHGLGVNVPGGLEWLALFLILGVYFVFVWHKLGQTLAMQTWRLQLVDATTGRAPTLRQCIIRYVLAWPSLLLIVSGVGILWAAYVDRDRQFVHDRLAGTCVIFDPPQLTRR